jgi:hypothetical protein
MLPKGGVGAEIGVWKGDYSAKLLELATPAKLHLIDPWETREDPNYDTAWYGKARGIDMDGVYAGVRDRFQEQMASGQVHIHRAPSVDAMETLSDGSLDFVYIDGDHAYEGVKPDLEVSVRKIRKGGLICIDDHMVGKWWGDGIVRAVNETLGKYASTLQLAFCADSQVVIVKRDAFPV